MERMRTWNLVRRARDVSRVVVPVAGLVMAVREDGQMTLRLRGRELGFCAGFMERLLACVELQIEAVLRSAAKTFPS
jgi:hypothetical protein